VRFTRRVPSRATLIIRHVLNGDGGDIARRRAGPGGGAATTVVVAGDGVVAAAAAAAPTTIAPAANPAGYHADIPSVGSAPANGQPQAAPRGDRDQYPGGGGTCVYTTPPLPYPVAYQAAPHL
jgi:hypothetical protein